MKFDLKALIRPNIAGLIPYSSARDEYTGDNAVLLDANENPFNLPHNRYPDPHQKTLKEKIAGVYGIAAGHIFLGNGSDEAIDLLFRAFCIPGRDEVISIDPSYGMYEVSAKINDVALRKVLLNADFNVDAGTILNAAGPDTKMIFLCSPNNPTSNLLSEKEMLKIASGFGGLLVVDEAYIEFAGIRGMLHHVGKRENLVVLRTFSKAWGLAGIRLGMAFASPAVIRILDKIKYPYNVNALTQEYARKALDTPARKEEWVREILSQRQRLEKELQEYPFIRQIYPSDANFLLVKVDDPGRLYRFLREGKVIVRDRSGVSLCEGCLRITVGTPEENTGLITLLNEYNAGRN